MIANIECLAEACRELGVSFHFVHPDNNFISVDLTKRYYFVNCTTPFNSQDVARICLDKDFTQKLLESVVRMPKSISFLDPAYTDFNAAPDFRSVDEITHTIIDQLGLPVVIKMNSGSRRRNVHKCFTPIEVKSALQSIYNQDSKNYDFLALAQEMIDIDREYRVIVYQKKIQLVYEKYTFVPMRDEALTAKIAAFLEPMYGLLDLNFAGVDLAVNTQGETILIELNSSPRFGPYVKHNGKSEIVTFYRKLLTDLRDQA